MKIKIPYTDLELSLAGITASKKFEEKSEEELDAIQQKIEGSILLKNNVSKLQSIADHFGIPLEMLVNSPNYKTMTEQYESHLLLETKNIIQAEFDLTDVESWAILRLVLQGISGGDLSITH